MVYFTLISTMGINFGVKIQTKLLKLLPFRKKAIRLLSFSHFQAHTDPIFKKLNLLKLVDIIKINNIIFTHSTINKKSPTAFSNYFKIKQTNHQHMTTNNPNSEYSTPKGSLEIPDYKTKSGKSSIRYICSNDWNFVLKRLSINFQIDTTPVTTGYNLCPLNHFGIF